MTIYVNGRFLTEEATGVQRFAEQLVLALSDLRDDVIVLAPRGARSFDAPHVRVREVGSGSPLRWEQWDLPRWLRRNGSPLLVNLGNRAPVLYRHQVSTLHDLLPMRYGGNFSLRFRAQFRLIAALGVIRRSHRVMTVSDAANAEIRAFYGLPSSRTSVVYNAVDHRSASLADDGAFAAVDADVPYVLAFGRAGLHRNAAVCVRAMQTVIERSPLNLVFVGSPDPALIRMAEGLGSRCVFTGRISDAELERLYSGACCFVAPSKYEGFDIPPLEAQRAGAPVIASDLPVHHEVLGSGALYFEPNDPERLADAIEQVASDPGVRRDLIARGSDNYTRFDWHSSATRLSRVIDEVVA